MRGRHGLAATACALAAVLWTGVITACGSDTASTGQARPSSPTSTPAIPGTTPPGPGPWHLAFSDDFHGTSLDASRWVTCYDWNDKGCTNSGNHELQWYLPSQVTVADGAATLTAQRQDTPGSDGKVYPWTSGLLSSGRPDPTGKPRFTYTYGYLEASVKFPPVSPANQFFPAFWLLTTDGSGAPEIDIVELIGDHTVARFNYQWRTATGVRAKAPHDFLGPVDYSAGYHTFGLDWEPGSLTWYVDGIQRFTFANNVVVPTQPLEIIFTFAIGPGTPVGVTSGTMNINQVRLWQH